MEVKFTKMHGCGNDYVYIDCFNQKIKNPEKLSIHLSDRRKSIGGDGIIPIGPSERADANMRIFNKDGSEGMMCGNGIRCAAKFLIDNNLVSKNNLKIETLSGIKEVEVLQNNGDAAMVHVDMGKAQFEPDKIPVKIENKNIIINEPVKIGNIIYNLTCVSIGNPHAVIFCEDIYSIIISDVGTKISSLPIFPEGVNIEFVKIIDKNNIQMRVWERGSGETLACGTGSCASVVAAVLNGFCNKNEDVTVHLRGGTLDVNYTDDTIFMKGEAIKVFEGIIDI